MTKDFSHFDETGGISMVDVGSKRTSAREAMAMATVRMKPDTLRKLIEQALPKGDVLTTAKVAGVLAAKQTPALIPLAHPIQFNSVDITFDLDPVNGVIEVHAIVRCDGKTGVEMEAMTACAVASLTIYDMCKSAEKGIVIDNLQLVRKSGGKSGTWKGEGRRMKGEACVFAFHPLLFNPFSVTFLPLHGDTKAHPCRVSH